MNVLRPHISEADFVPTVTEMMEGGYKLAAVFVEGEAVAVVGYRHLQFLFNGKHIYIDDLSTLPTFRGCGYAGALLDFVAAEARAHGYGSVTLDSGHHRSVAHRLYLNKGYVISAHHFTQEL